MILIILIIKGLPGIPDQVMLAHCWELLDCCTDISALRLSVSLRAPLPALTFGHQLIIKGFPIQGETLWESLVFCTGLRRALTFLPSAAAPKRLDFGTETTARSLDFSTHISAPRNPSVGV